MKIYLKSYLAENFGDDLFIKILMQRYPNHKFYAISDGFDNYSKKYSNLKVYSNRFLFKLIGKFKLEKYLANKCDLVLTLGGSMFIENSIKDKDREFAIGKNKQYILGANFGPYITKEYFENARNDFEKAEDVCFREKYSYELFKDLPNVRHAPDIAFLTDVSKVKSKNSKKVVISVIDCEQRKSKECRENYENKIIEMISFFDRLGYEITLASLCKYEGDEEAVNRIMAKCNPNVHFFKGNLEETLEIFADSEIVVGTRFHANIIGMLLGKTVIPVIYSKKITNILDDIGFNGVRIDIDKIENFDINELNDLSKNRVENLNELIKKANLHFMNLDKLLM